MSDRFLTEISRAIAPPAGTRLWHGGASPLGCLRGVSAEVACWKPAPNRHSIWALTLHVGYWKYAVRRQLTGEPKGGFPRSPANWPAVPDAGDEAAWKADRALLKEEHRRLAAAVEAFDPARLDQKPPDRKAYTYGDLILGILMHDTYHTGQIQIVKRLYAELHG